jgi:acetyl-CoA C-acetyltransferase
VRLALERNRVEATECDHLELYSCFPCVPKYVRREFGFRSDLPLSVAGGLTFAGGPIRNYMMHATAAMVERLRKSGNYGLLFGNGGFMTDAHVVVLGRQPLAAASLPSSFDVQEQADALRGPVPRYVDGYVGPGSIETYTVAHDRDGRPRFGTVIGRTDSGDRFVCRAEAEDADLMSFLMSGAVDPIGERGRVEQRGDGFLVWRMP